MNEPENAKQCLGCFAIKPIAEFHHHKTSRGGYHSRCKSCRSSEHMARKKRHGLECEPIIFAPPAPPTVQEEKPRYQIVESRCPVPNRDGTYSTIRMRIRIQ